MATYNVDYNDERFNQVNTDKIESENKINSTYDSMINASDSYYQKQIDALEQYKDKQSDLQQQRTDFAIDKINQDKEQARKDYIKEQKGAYSDFARQTDKYGTNAETMAAAGLQNSGYSETVKGSMYNAYQNRIASARESFNKAVLNYDNSINQARLDNNALMAEIAFDTLQKQLELSLRGFEYKNQMLQTKLQLNIDNNDRYYDRWLDVQNQINNENAMEEQIRQYNEKMAEDKRQFDINLAYQKERDAQDQANWEKQYNLTKTSGSSSKAKNDNPYGEKTDSTQIKTPYYEGAIHPDAKNGTFKTKDNNGVEYQPDNVNGNKLSSSGYKVGDVFVGAVGVSGADISKQTIWKANGNYYVWDGSINDYVNITDTYKNVIEKGMQGPIKW